MAGLRRRVLPAGAVVAICLVSLACGTSPPPAGPIEASANDGPFSLTIRASRDRYADGESVEVWTRLAYAGPAPALVLVGSISGPVMVSLEQLDGPLDPGGGADDACGPHPIRPDAPIDEPYHKSGGFDSDGPDAAMFKAFFDDPFLRLPAGTYRFTAMAEFYIGDCGGQLHELEATITILVGNGSGQPMDAAGAGSAPPTRALPR